MRIGDRVLIMPREAGCDLNHEGCKWGTVTGLAGHSVIVDGVGYDPREVCRDGVLTVERFLYVNYDACEGGKIDGDKHEFVWEWWASTDRPDFMFWALSRLGVEDERSCMEIYNIIEPHLGCLSRIWEEDWCHYFYNHALYNLCIDDEFRTPLANRVRELFGDLRHVLQVAENQGGVE